MDIQLNEQEGNTLIQIIDVAVKTGGIQIASAAMHFVVKIQEALQASKVAPISILPSLKEEEAKN